jgi:glutaredoxin
VQQQTSWWGRLVTWWRHGQAPPLGHLHFVMYTRRGCHLCDDAWHLLKQAQQRHGFQLQAIDIDSDPALTSCYGEQIPVVTVNGKLRFHGVLNQVLLQRLLQAEAAKRARGHLSTDADDPPAKNY